jgi:type I restriction enzyme S subunit
VTGLPTGWSWATLNELQADEPGAITDGPFGSNLTSAHYTETGARVVRLQNIGDGIFIDAVAYISDSHYNFLKKHNVRAGDLLVASLGEVVPRACLAPHGLGPAIVKADCIRVRLSPAVEPRWVMYALQAPSVRKWAADQVHGVGRPRLGLKVIRALPVPLPPLEEQRRIIVLLEDHLSRLDAATSLTRLSVDRLSKLRLANLRRWRYASLDGSSDRLKSLGEVAETSLGKMLDAKKSSGESTQYLRNINVRWGRIETADVATVPLSDRERIKFSLQRGDLLVCEGGEPGRAAIWDSDQPMTYQKALHRVRVRPGADVQVPFLQLMLEEFVRNGRAATMFTGTTIKHLPQEKLRQILVPVPPLDVQARVLAEAREADFASARLQDQLAQVERRSGAIRRSLLASALSGQLRHAAPRLEGVHG